MKHSFTHDELIIDSFAGGGGASLGIAWACGRAPDIAINHDADALAMHAVNHPDTLHVREDVWSANLRKLTGGRPVGLLWASPDCKHFSRAKGGKPVAKNIRSLAWIVTKWASEIAPRMIFLENVREFADWGPLVPRWVCRECDWKGTEGQATLVRTRRRCPRCESRQLGATLELVPCPKRKGVTFRRFVGRLKNLGYAVEFKNLDAADYGAPTHRRRLFLIARRDGLPIEWPEATHGDPSKFENRDDLDRDRGGRTGNRQGTFEFGVRPDLRPYRTAAECIEWDIPCPSIFDRKKPLAEKTLRRIAHGIKRYVLDNAKPFIVQMQHANAAQTVDDPLGTITTQGNKFNLVTPVVARYRGEAESSCVAANTPLPTVTANSFVKRPGGCAPLAIINPVIVGVGGRAGQSPPTSSATPLGTITAKNDRVVITPVITQLAHGEGTNGRWGMGSNSVETPLGSIHAGGNNFAVVSPILTPLTHSGERRCHEPGEPFPTITTAKRGEVAIVSPTMIQVGYGERDGQSPRALDLDKPLGSAVAGGMKHALCAAFLAKHFGGVVGHEIDKPAGTVTTVDHHAVVAANMIRYADSNARQSLGCDEPLATVVAQGNKAALVYAFLVKYFGTAIAANLLEPLPTATGKDRFGLVTLQVEGETYVIVDIGMRMLTPRELARAQGFPDTYVLNGTKTSQVARIGNSVCPPIARALVAANYVAEGVTA